MKKKLLLIMLSAMMVLTMMPSMAFAEVAATDVCKIGNTGYATLAEAFAAATGGTAANPVVIQVLKDELPSFVLTTDADAKTADQLTETQIAGSNYKRIPDYVKLVAKEGGTTIKGHVELNGAWHFTMSGFTFDASYASQAIGCHHSTDEVGVKYFGESVTDRYDTSVMDNYQDNGPVSFYPAGNPNNHGNDGSRYITFDKCTFSGTYSGSKNYTCAAHARSSHGTYPTIWSFNTCSFETKNATCFLNLYYLGASSDEDFPTLTVEGCTFGSASECCNDNLLSTTGVQGLVSIENNTFNGAWTKDAKALSLGAGAGNTARYIIKNNVFNYTGSEDVVSIQIKYASTAYVNDLNKKCSELDEEQTAEIADANINVGVGTYKSSNNRLAYTYEKDPEVAQIGSKTYASLAKAVEAAKSGEKITLLTDAPLNKELVISKAITVDMNGKNINAGTNSIKIDNGDFSIIGEGKIEGTPSNYKLIYLVGSTDQTASDYSNVSVGKDVTVKCTNGYAIMLSAKDNKGFGVNIDVAGTVEGYYGALYINGSVSPQTGNVPVVNVANTASIKADKESAAVFAAGYGIWNIYGGDFSAGSCLYVKTGKVNIFDGNFNANGTEKAYKHCDSGYEATGDAIVIDNCGYPGGKPVVTISNGSFKSTNAKAVGSYSGNGQTETVEKFILAGLFSDKPADATISTACAAAEITDNTYHYIVGKGAASISKALTAGMFRINPVAYVATGYTVEPSGDQFYPYKVVKVTQEKPAQKEIVVEQKTETEVSKEVTKKEEVEVAKKVLEDTNVKGVADALTKDGQQDIIDVAVADEKSPLTQADVTNAKQIDIAITVVAEVKQAKTIQGTSETEKILEFELTPYAVVTTTDKDTGVQVSSTPVEVDNDYLAKTASKAITVKLGSEFEPKQVLHIRDDKVVEAFSKGTKASYENKTFTYDAEKKIVELEITQFSEIQLLGVEKYANVTFDANGGTGEMEPVSVEKGKTYKLPENKFTAPSGKEFKAWQIGEKEYAPGDELTITEDTSVKAVWKDSTTGGGSTDKDKTSGTTTKKSSKSSKGTKTGDENNMLLYFGLFDLMLLGIAAVLFVRLKSQKK